MWRRGGQICSGLAGRRERRDAPAGTVGSCCSGGRETGTEGLSGYFTDETSHGYVTEEVRPCKTVSRLSCESALFLTSENFGLC